MSTGLTNVRRCILSGLLAMTTAFVPSVALATDVSPSQPAQASVGDQTGTGSTNLTMISPSSGPYGGTEDPNNQDGNDADTWGDNLAFSVPASINYVIKPNGDLQGPSSSATQIVNHSNFSIFASHLLVTQPNNSPFNIVQDATAASASETENAVSCLIGPTTATQININGFKGATAANKKIINGGSDNWRMTAVDTITDGGTDQLPLVTSGHVANLTENVTEESTFATLHWYMSIGYGN